MLNRGHIRTLWQRLGEIYGEKWAREHSDQDSNDTWLNSLQDLSPEMLANGLRGCITQSHGFIPTLPEFRNMCLGCPSEREVADLMIEHVRSNRHGDDPIIRAFRPVITTFDLMRMKDDEIRRAVKNKYPHAIKIYSNRTLNGETRTELLPGRG